MKLVGVTACISGVAHTYMAAELLEKAAKKAGYKIQVETQGALGAENSLEQAAIDAADVAFIISEINIEGAERFEQSRLIKMSISDFLRSPELAINAIERAKVAPAGTVISV
ncbi:fructose PTS transporter subunit IIB [Vibrio mediterranei]|jgi:fructose-specific PTS system IIB-like component|uniref:protein-N(pi)-phosphohistidine--D-fructose phosphotransferase n=2 Tax=Vibrio TaxID=662 RepID=A0A2C9PEP4_9VIBR|nr:fructose PTS transporter subunit IIB [Vibrio mediterranei]EDL53419.1 predicted enzyme IIB component of PTS [Vibrio mediterranei AK1]KFA95022.1 PTS fructose transporter subunit IIB [Vibrio sp. ER1A]USD99305.1 PTS fructose transporter subunit IIB [Vibrio sp. SCSIO 43133]ASI91221.1 PTS fructose transporter subunit IIB [Vibrio mediterranei]AYV20111.1 PTS fructose transporter subunit IIB [Vibrio mediterranei]